MSNIEWKSQENIDKEIEKIKKEEQIKELMPSPEERIEALENMLLMLMMNK